MVHYIHDVGTKVVQFQVDSVINVYAYMSQTSCVQPTELENTTCAVDNLELV